MHCEDGESRRAFFLILLNCFQCELVRVFDKVELVRTFYKLLDFGDQSSGVDSCVNASLSPGRDTISDDEDIGRGKYGILATFPCLFRVRSCSPSCLELKPLWGLGEGLFTEETFSIQTHPINKTIIGNLISVVVFNLPFFSFETVLLFLDVSIKVKGRYASFSFIFSILNN